MKESILYVLNFKHVSKHFSGELTNLKFMHIFAHLLALRLSYFLKPKIKNIQNALDLKNVLKIKNIFCVLI